MIDAVYSRVSMKDQSLLSQQREVRQWCQANGVKPVQFTDKLSGMKFSREGLNQLLAKVRSGEVRRVIVWKLDRFGRSTLETLKLIQEFDKLGCAFVCTSQGIDTSKSNPAAKFFLTMMAAVAELERNLIGERTKAGLAVVRARGVRLGRPTEIGDVKIAAIRMMLRRGDTIEAVAEKQRVSVGSVHAIATKKGRFQNESIGRQSGRVYRTRRGNGFLRNG